MWFRGDSRALDPLVIQSPNSGKHDSGKHGHSRPYEGSVKVLHSLHRLFLNICPSILEGQFLSADNSDQNRSQWKTLRTWSFIFKVMGIAHLWDKVRGKTLISSSLSLSALHSCLKIISSLSRSLVWPWTGSAGLDTHSCLSDVPFFHLNLREWTQVRELEETDDEDSSTSRRNWD